MHGISGFPFRLAERGRGRAEAGKDATYACQVPECNRGNGGLGLVVQ